ncbi:MAG TPA: DUF6485 family protein [Elusimicrobiales bacterium]|nr:DUF6485 family protein [Elusimicrobiales bacterium]
MECIKAENLDKCNCTYQSCSRRGICCRCVAYHREKRQLPACYFDKESEKTYDRSIEFFIKKQKQ